MCAATVCAAASGAPTAVSGHGRAARQHDRASGGSGRCRRVQITCQRPQTIRFYARLRLRMLLSCRAYVCITGQHPAASVCDHGRWRDGRAGCVCLFSVVLYQAASHTLHLCPPPPRQTHTAAAVHLCCAHAESMRGEAARWQADRQEWLSCIRTLRQEANDKLLQVGAEPI
jgi:hypothetical protein